MSTHPTGYFYFQTTTKFVESRYDSVCVHTQCGRGQDGNIVAVTPYTNTKLLAQPHTHMYTYRLYTLYLQVKIRFVFCIVSIILMCKRTDVSFIYSVPGGRTPAAHYTVILYKTFEKLHGAPGTRTVNAMCFTNVAT